MRTALQVMLAGAAIFGAFGCASSRSIGLERATPAAIDVAPVNATVDADEQQSSPVPHRYLHGVIPDDAKFQLALPDAWNGKLVVFSRGFSGTELTTGAFKTVALQQGYAFAASDEGWNRVSIARELEDTYYESRARLRELTLYARQSLTRLKGRTPSRTLIVGGSNGGHHTKWMLEDCPELFDGGLAGYGFNSQVGMWGSIATVLRNYDVIADRIDDIIAKRALDPAWDPKRTPLSPPLTAAQVISLDRIYRIPATLGDGFTYDVGRWPGSEAQWKASRSALVSYLRDSMPRFDPTFNPGGGALEDAELPEWNPAASPKHVQAELRRLDLTGRLQRPVLIMHGTADPIVSPGETAGYQALVERRLGKHGANELLAVYYIPGLAHGGKEFDNAIAEQLEVLERWIDFKQSGGTRGSLPPDTLSGYRRTVH